MSNRRRPRNARLAGWPEPGPGESYAHQFAVALDRHDDACVDEARTASHDHLLGQLGDRQRSGVWWSHHHAGEASGVIDTLYGDLDPADQRAQQIVSMVCQKMQDPSALLVIAWCIGEVPPGVQL